MCARRSARPASAPSHGCRNCCRRREGLSIVDGFRAAVAGLRAENGLDHEATIVGAFPVIAGALVQQAKGRAPIAPDPNIGHAADTLKMLLGERPEARSAAALDTYFVTVCDHGMNASTFTTRVVASTQADLFAAVAAGYCALTGPLHGGAPEPVLEMLDAIGRRERIKPWVDDALSRGERLMGFGHRVYRVRDPRADVLKVAVERLSAEGADLPFAGEVEAYIREALRRKNPNRPLETNVEFFTAILLDALAIPRQAFTPIFAVARAAGWTAHALEQRRTGRLIRPSSSYVGRMPAGRLNIQSASNMHDGGASTLRCRPCESRDRYARDIGWGRPVVDGVLRQTCAVAMGSLLSQGRHG